MATGTSSIGLTYNLSVPTATVTSTASEYYTTFSVGVGQYSKVNDVIELEITLSTDTDFANSVGTQIAVLDQPGINNGLLDWVGEPPLPNGTYIGRIRARRSGVSTDWSAISSWTVTANYGLDVTAPVLSNPSVSVTADTAATLSIDTDEGNGTLYTVVSLYSRVPSADQVIAGRAVDSNGVEVSGIVTKIQTVSGAGTQTVDLVNLVKATSYYAHSVHVDLAGNKSNVSSSAQFTQTDSTPPVVTGVAASALTATTGSGQATTSQPFGLMSWVVTTSATAPSAQNVIDGKNHLGADAGTGKKGSSAVTLAGAYSFNFSSLTGSTNYYLHVVHEDELGQRSTVASSALWATPPAADVTAPTLTSPTLTGTSDTTASWSVSTNEANGTLYGVITTSSTKPTAAQIRAGQNHLGATAPASFNQAITSTGNKTGNVTGLTQSTTYYAHYTHRDAAGNDATVVSSTSITTIATPSGGDLGSSIDTYFIGFTNSTTPEFTMALNSVQVGDVLRLSWSGQATGFKDKTVTSGMLDPADGSFLQFSWNDGTLPTFAYGTYAFTIRQTRGGSSITGPTMNVTLAASGGSSSGGGSGGTVENPPPPAVETYYYLTEASDVLVMEDGISYYLREGAP